MNGCCEMYLRLYLTVLLLSRLTNGITFGDQPIDSSFSADLVLHNGKIVTMDAQRPQVQALACRDDVIVAIGSDRELETYIGNAKQAIDLQGRLAIPGFIEGHGHLLGIGEARMSLDLTRVRNWDEVIALVREQTHKTARGEWIVGRGWHQEKWDRVPSPNVEGFPTHESLSSVSPDHPVLLAHVSGHATFANARAMELAGISHHTPDPDGGEILRDARGNPTGVFRETASGLVRKALLEAQANRSPLERERQARQQLRLAIDECLSKGITSFQDAGSSFEMIDLFKRCAEAGELRIRLWVMVRESNRQLARELSHYRVTGNKWLTVRAIKGVADGALGSRGAWLLEPYDDLPGHYGLNVSSAEYLAERAQLAVEHDCQLCVHAIGDRGNREVLDLFEHVFELHPHKTDWRWRVEHVSLLHPADIPRFAKLSVIASMQGYFCPSDAPYAVKRLGAARCEQGLYVWRELLDTGAMVINGSDAPVEDVSPILNFYASISRKAPGGGAAFYPQHRMTREEALKSYTLDAAYAAFEDDIKGSLTPGKLADICVLSQDLLTVPEEAVPSTEVAYTIVGGQVMYEKEPAK